ncbi:hypothetical protein ACRDU6_19600 [Mycolicibacterium sp. ELW1]|uniref:hypothetical protein n=1 Tax=Mycobacteriaceae TaxID=1762 RepID=UPI0011EF9FCC|nr:hypothetical protein [Mycobacterium sp. ELW1]QEN14580.1 hypothetical protein D3H54_16145 [Mycobacterium sp. ELW1]
MTAEARDHRLEFFDQTAFELMRATGRGQLMQAVWVYEHPVDVEGLRRFHRNIADSLGGRRIERSPLPFGRPRWVQPREAPSEIQFNETPRPRDELMDWADELATLPIDPERGPTWYLVVQPLTDGATAISIVASHVIGDGTAAGLAIFEAVTGNVRDGGYDRPGSRPRRQALAADARQALRDLPETRRALAIGAKLLWSKRRDVIRSRRKRVDQSGLDEIVHVPSVAAFVDLAEWDARAESLGGNGYSLLVGVTAKVAERLGRRRKSDGAVTLVIAINLRESLEDDRALAMAFANATVDPEKVTVDLTESRAVVRESRQMAKEQTDPAMQLFPLMPWLPQVAVKGVAELLFSYSEDLPVSCSNLGDLPPQIAQVDGTTAEKVVLRALDQNVTRREIERSHGQLVVVSARINGKVVISIEAYEIGAENTKQRLRGLVDQTLTEFGLNAVIE